MACVVILVCQCQCSSKTSSQNPPDTRLGTDVAPMGPPHQPLTDRGCPDFILSGLCCSFQRCMAFLSLSHMMRFDLSWFGRLNFLHLVETPLGEFPALVFNIRVGHSDSKRFDADLHPGGYTCLSSGELFGKSSNTNDNVLDFLWVLRGMGKFLPLYIQPASLAYQHSVLGI